MFPVVNVHVLALQKKFTSCLQPTFIVFVHAGCRAVALWYIKTSWDKGPFGHHPKLLIPESQLCKCYLFLTCCSRVSIHVSCTFYKQTTAQLMCQQLNVAKAIERAWTCKMYIYMHGSRTKWEKSIDFNMYMYILTR